MAEVQEPLQKFKFNGHDWGNKNIIHHYEKAWHAGIKYAVHEKTYRIPMRHVSSRSETTASEKSARETKRHIF